LRDAITELRYTPKKIISIFNNLNIFLTILECGLHALRDAITELR
jgi:hypothetical protein